jgi:rSAM/selenodomain-associated transferase 1
VERIVLFAKSPRRGGVKTRLVPPLTHDDALALHEAMLADQIDFLRSLVRPERAIEVCLDGAAEVSDLPWTLQGPGDLGHRLTRAFERSFAAGYAPVLVLGADAPTLPRSLLEECFERLAAGATATLVPALDGGYVAIALSGLAPHLFDRIPWGGSQVLETTWARAVAAGTRIELTGTWGDVDAVSDLARLRDECRADPGRAPRTAAILGRIAVL